MLVLSRKQGQSVQFAEMDVVVHVISVKGSRVQLGIDAPPEIRVTRPEKLGARSTAEKPNRDDQDGANDPISEAGRIRDQLSRVDAELAALAELADEKNLSIARRVAADSIGRLESIRRSLSVAVGESPAEARPIGDFVQVRTEVLEQLRQQQTPKQPLQPDESISWPDTGDRPTCVRQSSVGYAHLNRVTQNNDRGSSRSSFRKTTSTACG